MKVTTKAHLVSLSCMFLVVFVIYHVSFQPYRCGYRIVLSGWSWVPKVGLSSSVFHLTSCCKEGWAFVLFCDLIIHLQIQVCFITAEQLSLPHHV